MSQLLHAFYFDLYVYVYIALSVLSSQRTCLTNKYKQDYFREITLSSLSYLFITSLKVARKLKIKTRDNAVARAVHNVNTWHAQR